MKSGGGTLLLTQSSNQSSTYRSDKSSNPSDRPDTQSIKHPSNTPNFDSKQKKHILHKLNQAVAFESFLHKKFVGQKRFSLEGAESLIPALDALIEHGSELGVKEFEY